MTFFLAQVTEDTLTWVCAGHEAGLLLDPCTGDISELMGEGMVLGFMPNEEFEEKSVPFAKPGSVLAVVSDGITEAMDGNEGMFGRERLEVSLRKYATCPAQGILRGVLADVAEFCGSESQNDDVTLAIVMRVG